MLKVLQEIFCKDNLFRIITFSGLLLYNGQKRGQGDFISLVLNNGYVEFRFELGSGPAIIRSDNPVEMGQWHLVKISRHHKNGKYIFKLFLLRA